MSAGPFAELLELLAKARLQLAEVEERLRFKGAQLTEELDKAEEAQAMREPRPWNIVRGPATPLGPDRLNPTPEQEARARRSAQRGQLIAKLARELQSVRDEEEADRRASMYPGYPGRPRP